MCKKQVSRVWAFERYRDLFCLPSREASISPRGLWDEVGPIDLPEWAGEGYLFRKTGEVTEWLWTFSYLNPGFEATILKVRSAEPIKVFESFRGEEVHYLSLPEV